MMSDTQKELGQRIKELRKQENVTQEELAERLGIAKVTVTLYEGGRNNFTFKTLQRIADALGYSVVLDFKKK
jgi:transcriptional regulator with XRE-family HTH domain